MVAVAIDNWIFFFQSLLIGLCAVQFLFQWINSMYRQTKDVSPNNDNIVLRPYQLELKHTSCKILEYPASNDRK